MNWILRKGLLVEDKFVSEMHLRQLGLIYSACGSFIKNEERIQDFQATRDSRYIYQNEIDHIFFQNDMVYGGFKDFPSRTSLEKVLCCKAFAVVENTKFDEHQREPVWMVYNFFDKMSSGGAVTCAWSKNLATWKKSAI